MYIFKGQTTRSHDGVGRPRLWDGKGWDLVTIKGFSNVIKE